MRSRDHLALGVALLSIAAVGGSWAERALVVPTATVKVCHVCEEETPQPPMLQPTASPTCDECNQGATRAAGLATVIADQPGPSRFEASLCHAAWLVIPILTLFLLVVRKKAAGRG